MIYLDNAATTKVCPEAAEAAIVCMTDEFGNPSSTHALGRNARLKLNNARSVIAASIGAQTDEIYFTAGGTEGDNWAIRSGSFFMRHKGKHVISSETEHDAVLQSLQEIERQGYEITLLKCRSDGAIHVEDVMEALRPDTTLVSLMLVNNETGSITDIPAISKALKKANYKGLLHTDAVQAYTEVSFTAKSLGADMITLSGHKIHAPKGIGALYIRHGIRLSPLLFGGGQESGFRSGTENLPGICAFAAAVQAAKNDKGASERIAALRQHAIDTLLPALPGITINGGGAPHILNMALPGYKSEVLLNLLDAQGICVSKGSACKKGKRSHVLEAMKLPADIIDGSIRISLSRFTTKDEIDTFCQAIINAAGTLFKKL